MYTSLLIVLCDVQGTWFVVTSRTIAPTSIIKQGAIEYRDASSVWLQKHAQLLNYKGEGIIKNLKSVFA